MENWLVVCFRKIDTPRDRIQDTSEKDWEETNKNCLSKIYRFSIYIKSSSALEMSEQLATHDWDDFFLLLDSSFFCLYNETVYFDFSPFLWVLFIRNEKRKKYQYQVSPWAEMLVNELRRYAIKI